MAEDPNELKEFSFEIPNPPYPDPFRDALRMTQAEYNALTPEALSAMQMERFNNWKPQAFPAPEE